MVKYELKDFVAKDVKCSALRLKIHTEKQRY